MTYTVTDSATTPNSLVQTFTLDVKTVGITWTGGNFVETAANDGTIMGDDVVATLTDDTFVADVCTSTRFSTGVAAATPSGITIDCTRNSATMVTFTYGGTADNHADADDLVDTPSGISFSADAFTDSFNVVVVANSDYGITFDFNNAPLNIPTITAQSYSQHAAVTFTLPEATGGTGLYTYTLTPTANIPSGLTFTPADRTLTGMPTAVAPAAALTYTVTDSTSTTASQTFSVTIRDTTPPTVTSVRFYDTEAHAMTGTADNTITEAQIGNSVYVSIQFSENMRNVNHTITPFVQGIPRITQKYIEPQRNRVETLQNQIIAHDAAFPDFTSRCRAAGAPPTDRYLCRVLLLSTQHAVAPLTIVMPGEDNRVTDVAGNTLAAEYTSSELTLSAPVPPSVTSVKHYPSAAAAIADFTSPGTGGTITDTWDTTDPIYSVIQFAGPALESLPIGTQPLNTLPTARPQIFHQLGTTSRVQFGIRHLGGDFRPASVMPPQMPSSPPPHDRAEGFFCQLFDEGTRGIDSAYWCSYAPGSGSSGTYKIIVGAETVTAVGVKLGTDWDMDTGITLAVPTGPLGFSSQTVADRTYTVGATIPTLTLPAATGGTPTYTYTLTPTANIPSGLTFTPADRTLTGTPIDAATAAALTYTVTDSAGATASQPFSVTVTEAPVVTLVLTPDSITESGTGNTSTITATLDTASAVDTTVTVTAPSGATVDDYMLSGNTTLTIAAGNTTSTGTVILTATDNDVDAPDATTTVSATATNAHAVTGPDDVTLTIVDDDAMPTVTLVLTPASIAESGGSSTVTATIDRASAADTIVTVTDPTGDAAGDYTLSAAITLTIAAGTTASTGTVTLTAEDNDVDAPDKASTVSATAANTHGVNALAAVMLTITDDDATPTVTLVLDSATISESGTGNGSTITATMDRASGVDTIVTVTAPTGANVGDYTLTANTTLTIAAGTTASTGTVALAAIDNDVDAPDKTSMVSATAVNSHAVNNPADVTLTITDDDATPTVTLVLTPASIPEDGGESTVTATLSHPSSAATMLTVTATPDSAAPTTTVAGDYTLSTTTMLTIAAGATTSTGTVTITGVNNDVDSPPETKQVTVAATATNTHSPDIVAPADVTLTITDAPAVMLVLTPASISESGGSNSSTITATLGRASTEPTTLTITATPADTGTAATDYTLSGTTLTIAAGQTASTGTVTITAVDNAVDAPNKTVTVSATAENSSSEGVAPPSDVVLTITDDDDTPTVTLLLTPATISESGTTNSSTVTATLSHPSSAATMLTVAAEPGTGAATGDYALAGTDLTIAAGDTTSTGTVTITATDNAMDATTDKTITVSATAANTHTPAVAKPADVTLTITDDDIAPTKVGTIGQQTVFFTSGQPGTLTLDVTQYFQASGVLTYAATSDDTNIATVAIDSGMLTITSVAGGSAMITVTANDEETDNSAAMQTFTVQIVQVTVTGATVSNTDGALALDNVGGVAENDVRLTLPSGHAVTTIMVMTYDPLAATVPAPPNGVTFGGVAVDIELVQTSSLPSAATVCLSTAADADIMTGRRAALYHLPEPDAASWTELAPAPAMPADFVCGNTNTFSPITTGYEAVADTARLNEQILSRASQAITAGTLAAVAARVEGGDSMDNTGTNPTLAYQFGGQSSLRGLFQAHGQAMLQDEMDYARLLDGASFVMPLSAADGQAAGNAEGNSAGLSLWGSSDYRNLGSDNDGLDWDGEIRSFHFGVDGMVSESVLAGLALSLNQADFDYRDTGNNAESSGDYEYQTTNLHPYFGWLPSDDLKVWASAGIGQGEIEIEAEGSDAARSTDTEQWSLGGGFSHRLLVSDGLPDTKGLFADATTTLHLKGDVALTQVAVEAAADENFAEQDIDSQRVRLLLSGEQRHILASGGAAMPSMEVGVRVDDGDGESASGVEVGTGLRYVNPDGRLAVSGKVRGLLSDEYDEWGAELSVRLSPSASAGRGLSLSVNPVWGEMQSAAERLWDEGASELGVGGDTELQSRMDSEIGYGIATTMLGSVGMLTPYTGMTTVDGGVSHVRLGGRFVGGDGLRLNLEGAREHGGGGASHTVLLRGEFAF